MNTTTTVNRFRTVIATALFGAVASSFAVLPAAADSFDAPQVTVKFGDLNISNSQGAAVLYGRIRAAAERVCSPYDESGLEAKMRLSACIDKAIFGAVTKVNAPALSAVYSTKTGKEVPMRLASTK